MKPTAKAKDRSKSEFWDGTGGDGLPEGMKPYNHQAIPEDLIRRVKVYCAQNGITVQEFVTETIEEKLNR